MPDNFIDHSSPEADSDSEPEPSHSYISANSPNAILKKTDNPALFGRISRFFSKRSGDGQSLREAIEGLMDDHDNEGNGTVQTSAHERLLISNILKMQDSTVDDVMIPRADIIAIDVEATQEELMSILSEHQYSRIPVYRETLDDVIGTVHIKDILAQLASGKTVRMQDIIRDIPIVSPAMPVLDLILFMKEKRKHMVLVVDEYGGIDGLATLGDIIETIVGEIEDEYDTSSHNILIQRPDKTILADGRVDLEDFEEKFGAFFTEEEREETDTLGGLVSVIAGRVPARGEILQHDSGLEFEILDADPRRINRLKIRFLDRAVAQSLN